MLRAARQLDEAHPVDVVATLLAAHEVPPDMPRREYLDLIINELIPAVAAEGLAEYCDAFCEQGVYSIEETTAVMAAAARCGLRPRLHADQLHDTGAAALAARIGAASADHLEHISDDGIAALAGSDTVAVLLPGCTFFMGLAREAPARKLVTAGVPVALATDFNPGSSMTQNLQLIMTIACTRLRLTPAEALGAVTVNAAYSLGRGSDRGRLAPGLLADVAIFDVRDPRELVYRFGEEHTWMTIKRGRIAWTRTG
jgi:imidazolonepropionase